MNSIELNGCRPIPMAGYLKAIAVIRILYEQKDKLVKGYWKDEHFFLTTVLGEDELVKFFCEQYHPTPIVSPWNGGAGFYEGSASGVVRSILNSSDERLSEYRATIKEIQSWDDISFERSKMKAEKPLIHYAVRNRLPELALQWVDATFVRRNSKEAFLNPVFGTGGNEGNFEMSNNFMQHLIGLFLGKIRNDSQKLLKNALFGTVIPGLVKASIGQLYPGRAGGYNQGMGIEQKDFKINPWDIVLMMEGGIALAGGAVKRCSLGRRPASSLPFTVDYSSVGFTSSLSSEGKKGRSETWLPIWSNPAGWEEIHHLFSEGRATIGRTVAKNGLEFSRAVGLLGTDKGISSFERYVYLKRRGDSYVAIPAGRVDTRYKPQLEILNELDPILFRAGKFLGAFKQVPASFRSAYDQVEDAMFQCSLQPDADRFQKLLRTLGSFESLVAARDRRKDPALSKPLFGLSPRWVSLADDSIIEVRIAAAIASITHTGDIGNIRHIMAGTHPRFANSWQDTNRGGYWQGKNLPERLSYVLERRLLEAERTSTQIFPVEAHLAVSPYDVASFLNGMYDDNKLEELLWAFTLIDWKKPGLKSLRGHLRTPLSVSEPLSRLWCTLKLLHSPLPIGKEVHIKREPRILPLLIAGRIDEAVEVAVRRLYVSGAEPHRVHYVDSIDGSRLAAGLLIPIHSQSLLETLVLKKKVKK